MIYRNFCETNHPQQYVVGISWLRQSFKSYLFLDFSFFWTFAIFVAYSTVLPDIPQHGRLTLDKGPGGIRKIMQNNGQKSIKYRRKKWYLSENIVILLHKQARGNSTAVFHSAGQPAAEVPEIIFLFIYSHDCHW
jgi:hypothetical protein